MNKILLLLFLILLFIVVYSFFKNYRNEPFDSGLLTTISSRTLRPTRFSSYDLRGEVNIDIPKQYVGAFGQSEVL